MIVIEPRQTEEGYADWKLTTLHSSTLINDSIFNVTKTEWYTPTISSLTHLNANEVSIVTDQLRQGTLYEVSATLTNDQNSFSEIDSVKFVPNKCTWYTISDNYKEIRNIPGQEDISFDIRA